MKSKELVAILPEWRTEVRPIYFLYPSGKFLPQKLKGFIAIAERIMKPFLQ
jgi:hypothetical protein